MLKLQYSHNNDKYKYHYVLGSVESIFNTWFIMKNYYNPTYDGWSLFSLKIFNLSGEELDPKKGINELYAGDY